MKPSSILISAFFFSTGLAWPSYLEPAEILERGRHLLEARQQSSTYNLGFSGDQGEITASSTATSAGSSTRGGSASTTSHSGSTTTGTTTSSSTSKGTSAATRTTFDARSPPGGISMQTPNPYTATYFRIEDYITLGWNYTSCSVLPTAIDILAVASSAQRTFTLAVNQTVSGPSQAFTWDSGKYQATAGDKLLTASYTLVVHDADADISALPSAGYLATWNQFSFAMYLPQPSASFSGITCITCSGALSSIEKQAYSVIFGMMAVTVLSFTWFAGAAGVF